MTSDTIVTPSVRLILPLSQQLLLILRENDRNIRDPLRWALPERELRKGESHEVAAHGCLSVNLGLSLANLMAADLLEVGACAGYTYFFGVIRDEQAPRIRLSQGLGFTFLNAAGVNGLCDEGIGNRGLIAPHVAQHYNVIWALVQNRVEPNCGLIRCTGH